MLQNINWRWRVLLFCFFLSGVSGLIYEVVWTRKLTLIFGSTMLAVGLSLAAYLGGLALGAYAFGRLADKLKRPAQTYGVIEMAIGLYGVLSTSLLDAMGPVYRSLYHFLQLPFTLLSLVQFGLVSLVLLVPTVLMGGTLPILTRASTTEDQRLGVRVGRLYGANTFGAAIGAATAGFLLLPVLGLQGSLNAAACLNVGLGLLVVAVFSRPAVVEKKPQPMPGQQLVAGLSSRTIATIVCVSGFCALFYEVLWTRALELVLGSSMRAFSLMLATFLLGLTLGIGFSSWMIGHYSRRGKQSLSSLALVQVAIALSVFAGGLLLPQLPDWFVVLYARYGTQPTVFLLWQAVLCASILLIPTVLIGMVFPLAVEASGDGREGERVGRFYAANTAGSIAGALLAGLVFIPILGIARSLMLGAVLNLALAAWIALKTARDRVTRWVGLASALLLGVAVILAAPPWDPMVMTEGVYFNAPNIANMRRQEYRDARAKMKLLFYREGTTATVAVTRIGSAESLSINGRGEGTTVARAQVMLGHVPFMLGRPIHDVFIIGMGTGSTAGAVTLYPVQRIEIAELEPAVIEASRFFETVNHRPMSDRRVRISASDARNFLWLAAPASYDLIISQPSYPWVSGSAKLFTREFYELARSRLRSRGVVAQWLQLYNLDWAGVGSVLNTFTATFPETLVIEVDGVEGEVILLGTTEPSTISWKHLEEIFSSPKREGDLARIGLQNPPALLGRVLFGPTQAKALGAGQSTNTDDNGLLELSSTVSLYRDTSRANVERLRSAGVDPWRHVADPPERIERQRALMQMARSALLIRDYDRALGFARAAVELGETAETYGTLGDVLYPQDAAKARQAWHRASELSSRPPLRHVR